MEDSDIVLVGDSIRLSYQPHAAAALADRRVWGPEENCESTRYLLANLDHLVLDRLEFPSVVHLNAGAHDLRRWPGDDYAVQVELDEYTANLEAIATRLNDHDPVTQIVFATTTPVIDRFHESGRWGRRRNADVLAYNDRLIGISAALGLVVNDLYRVIDSAGFDAISEDGIHLTPRGARYLGRHVAGFLGPRLGAAS